MNLLNHLDSFTAKVPVTGPQQVLRDQALGFLRAQGLPTRKSEDWKYTSLKVLNEEDFLPAATEVRNLVPAQLQALKQKLNPSFINIVFHNGFYLPALSTGTLPQGLSFEEVDSSAPSDFKDSFEALNTAYAPKTWVLKVAAEFSLAKVINLVFYTSSESAVMIHPRLQLQVGNRSSLRVLESYYGQSDSRYFVNSQMEASVGESARLTLVRLQDDSKQAINIGRTRFHLGKAAALHSLAYSTGAALARHTLDLQLTFPEAVAVVDGLYVVRGSQHVDNATAMDHQVGACNTFQHYKGILADHSRSVFNGKVVIRPGAQKANSEQLNNNLLLSRDAEADSKPQLEIYADDVKAAHGSTVGQLNKEELFYLESRAINKEKAIAMLSFGYVSELIYKLESTDLQHWLIQELQTAFTGLQIVDKL